MNDLTAVQDQLSAQDRIRLVFLADTGYACPSPKLMLLVDLDLAWEAGDGHLFPTDTGVRVAHDIVAQEVLSLPVSAGWERAEAQNRLYRLTLKLRGSHAS